MRSKMLLLALAVVTAGCIDNTAGPGGEELAGELGTEPLGAYPQAPSSISPSEAAASTVSCAGGRCVYNFRGEVDMPGELEPRAVNERADILVSRGTYGAVWNKQRGLRLLRPPTGYNWSDPLGQNNWGQAVGFAYEGSRHVAVAWERDGRPVLLSAGRGAGPILGQAKAINDNSVIVGTSTDGRAFRTHYQEGFRWLGTAGSAAQDVNFAGQIVGYHPGTGGARTAALWSADGTLTLLGALPGHTQSEAVAISETGIVVGNSGTGAARQGFIWTSRDGMKALPTAFIAADVNHWGEVAGHFATTMRCATWYQGYGTLMLPRLEEPNASYGCGAMSINSWGDVVGIDVGDTNRVGQPRPVVWTWKSNLSRYTG